MTTFFYYTIINGVGKKEQGTFEAESENDVRVNVYFVDVSRIDDSITYLRNVIERETPQ